MILSYEQERKLVKGILMDKGFIEKEADTVSKVVTHSDFTGVWSHGLSRFCRYMRQIKQGVLNADPEFKKVTDDGAVLVFDGDNGSGIVSINKAYDEALEKARQFGISFATGRHNANIGCGSYYGWRAVEDEVICMVGCNTYAFTSPLGGADRLIGTNPLVFAVPTDKECPMVLDMSTTCVAMGKIQAMEREGKPIPAEWAKDYDGNPTTDPSKAFSLSPIAAHKGYGLAVMIDVLSTMLSGAAYGSDIGLYSKLQKEDTGFFIIIIDPKKFMPIEDFKKEADRYIRMMKDSRKAPGVEEIYMPGELEYMKFDKNMKTGMDFSEALMNELTQLSIELGVMPEGSTFQQLVDKYN